MAIVRPEMVLVVPALNEKTWTALLPLTVSWFVPGPAISVLSVTVGSDEESMVVPVVVKTMVSSPDAALASKMACRSEPGPESDVEVTVKVAAGALASARSKMADSKTTSLMSVGYTVFQAG